MDPAEFGGRVMLKRALRAYGAVCVALVAAYYGWVVLRPVTTGAVSVAAIGLGLTRLRPQRRGGWLCIAASVVLLSAGDVVLTTRANPAVPVTYPGPPDVFYVAVYVPLAFGLLWLGRPHLPSRD